MRPSTRSFWTAVFSLMLVITSIAQPIAAQDVSQATPVADETESPTVVATETPAPAKTKIPVAAETETSVSEEISTPSAEEIESTNSPGLSQSSLAAQAAPTLVINADSTTFTNLNRNQDINWTGTLTLPEGHTYIVDEEVSHPLSIDGIEGYAFPSDGPNVYTMSYWIYPGDTFTGVCTDDNQLVLNASVTIPVDGVDTTINAPTLTVPCTFADQELTLVTPTGEVDHIEVCGTPDRIQANDIVTLVQQEGVELADEGWGNAEWTIDVKPAPSYVFTPDAETSFRISDTQTECEPSVIDIDEISTVLQDVAVGDEVSIPATLTLPVQNPFDVASLTFVPGTGGETQESLTPTRGVGGTVNLLIPYTIPANFADVCAANQGTMPLALSASLAGPNQGMAGVFTEQPFASESLPCSIATDLPTLTVSIESDAFVNVRQGDTVPVNVTITIPDGHPYDLVKADMFVQGAIFTQSIFYREFIPQDGSSEVFEFTLNVPVNEAVVNECNGKSELLLSNTVVFYVPNDHTYPEMGLGEEVRYPCSVQVSVTPNPNLVVHSAVCGLDNDEFSTPQEGVVVSLGEWNEGTNTLTFAPADGYYFPDGAPESMTVTESTEICEIEGEFPVFIHIEVCGTGNDEIDIEGELTIPEGAFIDTSEVWTDGVFRIWVTALPGYVLPEGTQTLYEFVDAGPCPVEGLEAPTHSAVCGTNNDEVVVPAAPDGVILTNSGEWSAEGTWTVSYVIEDEDYRLPDGLQAEYVFVDEGLCLVTPVPPSAPSAVCGPDNDVITVPDQPEGVIVEDSGWSENERTISWAPADGFAFLENMPASFSATDQNIPCEVEPEGKQLTVILNTSDGGSIEGTSYQVFAPSASMAQVAPFAEGVVDANNQIVLEELLPGEYRLVTAPDGYDPVDTTLSVTGGADQQEITLDVAAIQVPVTPEPTPAITPEPTVIPTVESEPTVAPTSVPTEQATVAPTQAPGASSDHVTGLPETGSGPDNGSMIIGLTGLFAAAMMLLAVGTTRKNRHS